MDTFTRKLPIGIQTFEKLRQEKYRAESKNPLPMIYQSGYLTIKGYDKEFKLYTLAFPNDEVQYSFLKFLVPSLHRTSLE